MADLASTRVFGKLTVMHEAIIKANAEIVGDITASKFIGDGSGLTGTAPLRATGTTKADVGLGNVGNYAAVNKVGDTMTGKLTISSGTYEDHLELVRGSIRFGIMPSTGSSGELRFLATNATRYLFDKVVEAPAMSIGGNSVAVANGSYPNLRAQATTKADVGLSGIPNTNGSTSNFLRGDGSWATPPNTNTTYSEITTAEIDAGTASTLRTITGRRMKYALDKKADTTTQVIAGTGLSGGGTLAANRTLSVNYGTAAGTAAQGNDSRIVNATPNTRTITAGTGLTGGGTLAANRTISLDSTSQTHLSRGNTAYGWGDHAGKYWNRNQISGMTGDESVTAYPNDISIQYDGGTFLPSGYGTLVTFHSSVHRNFQLFAPKDLGDLYIRQWHSTNNTWLSHKIWHEGNSDSFNASGNYASLRARGTTAADVGAPPTSRTITAGTGLSGGGNLTANRTLSVTYGTTAGTAAQGNDSRLSNSREWTASVVSQAEAEAGTATTARKWTAQRVRQAVAAYTTPTNRTITAGTGLSGGGDLTADRTLSVNFSSSIEAMLLTNTTTAINPARLGDALKAYVPGLFQTWQDMTTSRALNTTYTNTTARPIVMMIGIIQGSSGRGKMVVGGVDVFIHYNNGAGEKEAITTIVPAGETYRYEITAGIQTLEKWVILQ